MGTTGNAGSRAATNVMAATIDGVIGTRSLDGPNASLGALGEMAEIPATDYGYLRGRWLLH